ncbi:MAG: VOC family protein [Lachnospiraceae bacterium]|nr:VOC family protein [Lachnospiraceae bacterium]
MSLTLRMVIEDDLEMIMNWSLSGQAPGFLRDNAGLGPDGWKRWFRAAADKERSRYWIVEAGGTAAGLIYLRDIDWVHRSALQGHFAPPDSPCAQDDLDCLEMSLYDYCFDILELEEIKSDGEPDSRPSLLNTEWWQLREDREYERFDFSVFFDRGGWTHHVGMEVPDIETSVRYYQKLGWVPEGEIVYDSLRSVRLMFVKNRYSKGLMELVSRTGDGCVVPENIGLTHTCYEVRNIEKSVKILEKEGFVLTDAPKPSPAFGDRKAAFMYNKNAGLIELLEMDRFGNIS